jgi:hypothetical protein
MKSSNREVQIHWKRTTMKRSYQEFSYMLSKLIHPQFKKRYTCLSRKAEAHHKKIPTTIEIWPVNITTSSGNTSTSVFTILRQERQIWEKRDCFSIESYKMSLGEVRLLLDSTWKQVIILDANDLTRNKRITLQLSRKELQLLERAYEDQTLGRAYEAWDEDQNLKIMKRDGSILIRSNSTMSRSDKCLEAVEQAWIRFKQVKLQREEDMT